MSQGSVIFRSGRLRRRMRDLWAAEMSSDYGRRFVRPMDFNSKVRENAFRLHKLLLKEGQASLEFVKKRTPNQGFLLFASIGWLLREGVIEASDSPEGLSIRPKAA